MPRRLIAACVAALASSHPGHAHAGHDAGEVDVVHAWCPRAPAPNASLPWVLSTAEAAALSSSWGCESADAFARELVPWARLKHPDCGGGASCYTPLSGFPCYAVLTGTSGAVYLGVNFEVPDVSLSTTLHAEQLASLVAAGVGPAHPAERGLVSLAQRGTGAPCAHCRQWLAEFDAAPDLILLGTDASAPQQPMSDLNPLAFAPSALNNTCPLLARGPGCDRVSRLGDGAALGGTPEEAAERPLPTGDALRDRAVAEALRAYAPYTLRRSAVALRLRDGRTFAAGVFESVAFNPTIQPVVAALAALIAGGGAEPIAAWAAHIREAVLAEEAAAGPSYEAHTRAVLAALAPDATVRVVGFASPTG